MVRGGIFLIMVALVVLPFYSVSSSSLATHKTDAKAALTERIATEASNASANRALSRASKYLALPMPPQGPGESIATFEVVAGACTATPKNSFNLGETVCAVITGAPLGTVDRAATRIGWVSPYGSLTQGADITTDPQNGFYLIPATATQTFTDAGGGTVTVDNRGTWRVGIYSASDGSLRETALFTVHDPAKAFVDLSASQAVGVVESQVNAGSGGVFEIFVTNSGPDAAQDVVLTDNLSDNATFSSIVDDGFTCGIPVGTLVTCTLASMPAGTTKHLTLSYMVNGDTPVGAIVTNTVSVSSSNTPCAPDTPCELQPNDNSSTASAEVPAPAAGQTCTLLCHANFSVIADAFQEPGHVHGAYVFFGAASGNGSCGAIDATFTGIPDTVPATDPPTHIPASGAFYPVGTTVIQVSSATGGGNCSFTITVVEGTPPTISCPADKSATASTPGGSHTFTAAEIGSPMSNPTGLVVSFERSDNIPATYDVNGNVVTPEVVYSLTDPFPSGSTGINWTVTDSDGLAASCTQRILVHDPCATDTEPPTITAPPTVTVNTGPNSTTCGVALSPSDNDLGTPVVHDDCSASVSITGIPAGNLFPVGDTTLTYTATDGGGRTASDTQLVRVIDNTVPVIVAPANASYVCLSEVPAADASQAHGNNPNLPNGGPVFDNCGILSVTVSDSSTGAGSVASPRVITRTYTATDIHSNSASAVQIITVTDPTPPTFTSVPANASYQCASQVPAASPSQATASDNCTPPTITVADSSNGGAGSTASPLIITRTYTATDAAGNSTNGVQTITVIDNTPPTITAPANASYQCPSQVPAANASQATASDNCVAPTVTVSQTTNNGIGSTASPLVITRTFTATDAANNSASAVQTITVIDNIPPVITCVADIIADFDPAVNGAVVTYTGPVGTDNCNGVTITKTAGLLSGATFPVGTTVNTFTATDAAGNTASCSFKVTVALTSIIGLDSATLSGNALVDSYDSTGGYPATKGSLANFLSNGTVSVLGSSKMFGNVRSTRVGVSVQGTSQVTGNATAGTTVTKGASAIIGGTITNNLLAPVMTLPSVPACGPPYSSNSGITGTYTYNSSTGDLTLSGINVATLANGTYCFHNVTLTNSGQLKVNGPVTIKLTGTLSTSGATSLPNTTLIPSNLRILSSYTGTTGVTFGNSSSLQLVVYAPQTGVSITGSAPLFGTVVGKTITLSNSGMIHYDTQLKSVWPDIWTLIFGP